MQGTFILDVKEIDTDRIPISLNINIEYSKLDLFDFVMHHPNKGEIQELHIY
jgi:hypothetical protein